MLANKDSRSNVIEFLFCERKSDELATYVFPRFDDSISLSAETVLRSIIRQCLNPDDVTGEIETQLSILKDFGLDMNITMTLFRLCTSGLSKLYIVIDALDEFEKEERSALLQSLLSIISLPDSKAKLFLVGRSSISMDIRKFFPGCQEKSADCGDVQADIEAYTRETIALRQGESFSLQEKLILQDSALSQEIIEALTNGADGMYVLTFSNVK